MNSKTTQTTDSTSAAFQIRSSMVDEFNKSLLSNFLIHQNDSDIKKTHLFDGRYENIYLNEQHIPELKPLLEEAIKKAEEILGVKNLRAGYWFNHMPPGASTTLHTHDDDDELLSGVYYVTVPENSGNLIIYDNSEDAGQKRFEIESRTGEFIFFKPDVPHEVSKNNSSEYRLSIGMNFGRDK